jgi:hypothetical protein
MSVKNSDQQFINPQMGRFNSTQWSLALAAAERSTPESENALGALCASYWPPLYAYSWWDYSAPAYIQRLLYLVPSALLLYPLFAKAINRLSLMKKNRS